MQAPPPSSSRPRMIVTDTSRVKPMHGETQDLHLFRRLWRVWWAIWDREIASSISVRSCGRAAKSASGSSPGMTEQSALHSSSSRHAMAIHSSSPALPYTPCPTIRDAGCRAVRWSYRVHVRQARGRQMIRWIRATISTKGTLSRSFPAAQRRHYRDSGVDGSDRVHQCHRRAAAVCAVGIHSGAGHRPIAARERKIGNSARTRASISSLTWRGT